MIKMCLFTNCPNKVKQFAEIINILITWLTTFRVGSEQTVELIYEIHHLFFEIL